MVSDGQFEPWKLVMSLDTMCPEILSYLKYWSTVGNTPLGWCVQGVGVMSSCY